MGILGGIFRKGDGDSNCNVGSSTSVVSVGDVVGGKIIVNGKTYKGNNVSISGDKVIIDGVVQGDVGDDKEIHIHIEGDCGDIETGTGDIHMRGDVKGNINTQTGDVKADDVKGNISTQTGDVDIYGEVQGNVSSMTGDITYRK